MRFEIYKSNFYFYKNIKYSLLLFKENNSSSPMLNNTILIFTYFNRRSNKS